MRKLFLIAAAVAGLFAAASCQKEPAAVQLPRGEKVAAVLSVSVPEVIATKAYSEGTYATELHYAVYDGKSGKFLLGSEDGQPLTMKADLTCEVNITLVKNYAYDIVFWAQAPGAPYAFDKENGTITVTDNYDNFANDETRDAFYQLVDDYVYTAQPTTVELYRPFAQINFGASDYDEVTALGLSMTSYAEITGLPNVLNVLNRTSTGDVDAIFTVSPVPAASGEKLPVKGDLDTYGYVSMNYVLAPEDKAMLDNVKGVFKYNDAEVVIDVPSVPYQRNHRTNIIGDFFTGPARFEVEIIPIYDDPAYDVVWPLVTVSYDSTKDDFATVLDGIAAGEDKNVALDLGGSQEVTWNTGAAHGSTPLIGEDSGVERLTISNGTFRATGAGVGPIRAANGATLVFENVTIIDESVSYAENSWEFGYLEFAGNVEFINCTIVNAIAIDGDKAYFNSCSFNSNKDSEYAVWVSNGVADFVNCKFEGPRGLKMHEAYGSEIVSVTVDRCVFGPLSKKPGIAIGTVNADTKVSVTNSVFVDCQAGDQGLYIYETDTDVNTFDFTESDNTVK